MRWLSQLPPVVGVGVEGERLMALTSGGALGLYRYAPLQAALLSGLSVPFAARWPEHLKLFVYAYVPLPAQAASPLASGLDELGVHTRDLGGLRPWDQATYRGWPLYLWVPDHPGTPPGGQVTHLFEPVFVQQAALPPPGSAGQGP